MKKNGFSTILVILIVIGVAALGTGGYLYYKKSVAKSEQAKNQENEKENQDNKLDEEGTIRKFFTLVDEGNVDEAVKMMNPHMASDENTKNMWRQSLAEFESVKVTKIEKSDLDQNDQVYVYKVNLDVQLKPNNQLMNWNNGQDTRFVSVVKSPDNVWQIYEIATGP